MPPEIQPPAAGTPALGVKQPPGAVSVPKPEIMDQDLLKPMDVGGLRKRIYDHAFESVKNLEPIANTKYRLKIENPRWADPETWSPAHQKKVFYNGGTLARRIQGDWVLEDVATNQPISKKTATIAAVPHLNDRGLFLLNGSHWHLGSQTRLDPGVYPRIQANGEIEAYVNPKGGRQHRISLDPESGVFNMEMGSSKIPLLPVLKALGATNQQLHDVWGRDLVVKNAAKDDALSVSKLVKKLYDDREPPEGVPHSKLIADKLANMKLDPYVTGDTIGRQHSQYGLEPILDTTRRLLAISRGEEKPSERDHQAYQHILGQEHLFAERVKNSRSVLNPLLWRATFKGNLDHVPTGVLNKHLLETITATGLGVNAQMTNPAEMLDSAYRVSKMGAGGIRSLDAVPDESRNIQPSQFHFIDPVVTPESGKAGVDTRFASGTARDKDGKVYTKVFDQVGRPKWVTARDLRGKTVAPWESRSSQDSMVEALQDGEMTMVPKNLVHYYSSPTESVFSPVANMVPFKSASPPHRTAMGTRMMTQALPLIGAESPLVQSGAPGGGSFEHHYGKHFGAVRADRPGRVVSVGPDAIKVRYHDGQSSDIELSKHELYDHAPGRKTHFTQSPTVKAGDTFQPGQLLARSNYTDQNGRVALGLNARVAWLPARRGGSFEDAFAISESFANRMKSDHMSLHSVEDADAKLGKKEFKTLLPTKYTPDHLKNLDDNGVIRPGSIVQPGQPLILATKQSQAPRTTLVRSPKPIHQDASEVWDHDYPGEVVDVIKTRKGYRVSVKSSVPTQDADKMCYSDDTEVLTADGWKNVTKISFSDKIASLAEDGEIEYLPPAAIHQYEHTDKMYSLETTQVSLLVTLNHNLYVKQRYASSYKKAKYHLREAGEMFGENFKMKRNGSWQGKSPTTFVFPKVKVDAGQFGRGERWIPELKMPIKTYLMLLGMFLSEGNIFCEANGNYGVDIHQIKPKNRAEAISALKEAGIHFVECRAKLRVYGLQLYLYFKQFGKCWEKFIPNEVLDFETEDLQVLYKWLMWGDGHVTKANTGIYTTTSPRLADDFQRLVFHMGLSANIDTKPACRGVIKGKEYDFRVCYKVNVYRHKNEPEINYSYKKAERKGTEKLVGYSGFVYCVTLPRNHVLYVRRHGKPVWCGNSGRHGNKGIVTIVPDKEMPLGEDGKPMEVLVSPYTLSSRKNDSQIAELALGKIAARTGKPYEIQDFQLPDLMKFANDELRKHGIKSTETLHDPVSGVKIPGVLTGNQFFMKLHHLVEEKLKQRDVGGYDSFGSPARGGEGGAKRMAMADTFALLSHGASAFLRGSKLARGQRNEKMWEAILSGYTPPTPGVPMQYQRFIEGLKSSGIHPVVENGKMRLKALTDEDVDRFAGDRELQNPGGIDWSRGGDPVKGGLFDRGLHGEAHDRWSKMTLHSPMPNPAFEDAVRYTLGLTEKQMRNVIAGKAGMAAGKYVMPEEGEQLPRGYMTGSQALKENLKSIDLDREIARADADINGNKKTKRDLAIRRRKFLQGAKDQGIHPSQWILSKVPVLPPVFRPVSRLQGSNTELISDPNFLYQDLWHANKNLRDLTGRVKDVSEEKLAVYDALKAVTGLGDPINPKSQQKNVKGMLKMLLGESPKWSIAQHKLLSNPVDLVGRSTVGPDADLDMDEIGIPENMAFKVYGKFVTKRLVQAGMSPVEAGHALLEKKPEARRALLKEMEARPVSYHRAPVLHKYGHIGAWPKLVKGDVIKVSPFVIKGLGMDFDGDTANIHVPVYDAEVKDIKEKMMPSRNLLSVKDFTPHYKPEREFHVGLWQATEPPTKEDRNHERVFADAAALRRAFQNGEVSVRDKVVVMKH